MRPRNVYGFHEVIEYNTKQGPDGIWYPVTYVVIGHRKTINGQEVNDDGSPKQRESKDGTYS